MSKIRADLVGVVFVQDGDGATSALAAGDEIPDGAIVGPHLLDEADEADEADPTEPTEPGEPGEPKVPRGNASRDTWAAYAASLDIDVSDDLDRDAIKALVKAQD